MKNKKKKTNKKESLFIKILNRLLKLKFFKRRGNEMIKCNIFKPGTAKYYRDMLELIAAVAYRYDGYNPNSAKQMKELVDELRKMATDALNHKKLYAK